MLPGKNSVSESARICPPEPAGPVCIALDAAVPFGDIRDTHRHFLSFADQLLLELGTSIMFIYFADLSRIRIVAYGRIPRLDHPRDSIVSFRGQIIFDRHIDFFADV
ncbi:uncharacterized protein LOC143143490 [Ptiloglossa arizonensis]|uniref:uncharacterized protein LOC143143490 n=1 Tax=Ptiloglossa arizonensis TaxID=3350558 RepID=UPI003FA1140F